MKVLLVNGSPHKRGCTAKALELVGAELNAAGVETDVFWIGNKPIAGCMGCYQCIEKGSCVIDDVVGEFQAIANDYDGYVFGTPVYFAGMAGGMKAFMDRAFMSNGGRVEYRLKPAAVVCSARRAGTTAALEDLNKFVAYFQTFQVHSKYWPMVHGQTPEEVLRDEEGVQVMQTIGRNMAYLLKCLEAGRAAGIERPAPVHPVVRTNFIR